MGSEALRKSRGKISARYALATGRGLQLADLSVRGGLTGLVYESSSQDVLGELNHHPSGSSVEVAPPLL
jgi:hypothetical protein